MIQRTKCTMRDVARLAGVSTSTVSAVLNGNVVVRAEKKKRVLDAIAALDYHPDTIARGLKTGKSHAIGVVVPDITNAFYPEVIRGIEMAAQEAGYSVLLCDSNENPEREQEHLNMLLSRRVDGVLLACCANSSTYIAPFRSRFPIVFVDRIPPMHVDGTVSSDNVQAGCQAARHLIDLGHRKIAMFAGHLGLSPHRDRLEGFRKAMQERHLPIMDEYLISGDVHIEDGLDACRRLLALPHPPTAIMASNSKLLFGVLEKLEQSRVEIPSQISVLGFDDYLWNRYFNPSLTAVAQNTLEMGKRACELLFEMMEEVPGTQNDGAQSSREIRIPTELRIRRSTGVPHR